MGILACLKNSSSSEQIIQRQKPHTSTALPTASTTPTRFVDPQIFLRPSQPGTDRPTDHPSAELLASSPSPYRQKKLCQCTHLGFVGVSTRVPLDPRLPRFSVNAINKKKRSTVQNVGFLSSKSKSPSSLFSPPSRQTTKRLLPSNQNQIKTP